MKLLKKLAILTCALAAFSFVACDSGSSDDDEPNTPVVDEGGTSGGEEGGEEAGGEIDNTVWTYAEAGTVTRVAIDTSEAFGENNVGTWDIKNIYAYVSDDNKDPKKLEPLGEWGGSKLLRLSESSSVWYLNIPAAAMPTGVDVLLILNGSGKQIDIGSIRAGEQKIYKMVDGAAAFVSWPVAEQEGALAEGEEPEDEKISGTITIRIAASDSKISSWDKVYVYSYSPELFGSWTDTEMQKEGDYWTATASFTDLDKDTNPCVMFHNEAEDKFDATPNSVLINSATVSKVYDSINFWSDYTE